MSRGHSTRCSLRRPGTVPRDVGCRFRIAREGIVDYARDHGINLIVMGTHGRGGVAHLLLGSVAERSSAPRMSGPDREGNVGGAGHAQRGLIDFGQAEFFTAVRNLVTVDAEQLRRLGLIAARTLERLREELTFDVVEPDAFRGQREFDRRDAPRQREVLRLQVAAVDQEHGALDRVAQLADVAWPLVLLEERHGVAGDKPLNLLSKFAIELIDVEVRQQHHVALSLAGGAARWA